MELLENLPARNKKINFKKEISRYLKNWYWFVLSILLFYAAAQLYLRYAEKQYLSKTTLRFPKDKSSGVSASALSDLNSLGMGVSGDDELQTETTVIVSKPILEKVAHNLNLFGRVFAIGKVKEVEAYKDAPFTLQIKSFEPSFQGAEYILTGVGKNSFKLSGVDGVFRFGVTHRFPFGDAVFSAQPGLDLKGEYKVQIMNVKQAVNMLESQVKVEIPANKGMIMDLSMTGPLPYRSEKILDEIVKQYNIDGVKDKNLEAQGTQDFIAERLDIVTKDLLGVENQKESFKRQNEIADLESQAQISLENASENTKQIVTQSTQLDLINSIYAAASASDNRLMPSNMGLPASTEALIAQYNDLVITRNRTLKQATNANPAVIEMNKEIASLKGIIRKNLADTRSNLSQSIGNLRQQVNLDRGKIAKVPGQEKITRGIERELNLKEQLYLFLLQKAEENAITLAVTAPRAKVVNPAYTVGLVKPNRNQILLGAVGVGFILPLLLLYGKFSLDTKIHSREDLTEALPEVSVLTEVPLHEADNKIVGARDFSVYAESFRILSSNLKFMLKTAGREKGGIIVVTSSVKGEGKTTVSMNTALALAGKSRVMLVGADLRNPQLQRYIQSRSSQGLSDYLVAETESYDGFVSKSTLSPNLDMLISGTIPPNPNDLLDMQKFADLLQKLSADYDYVLLDSAPVMLVSDSIHIVEHADVVIYIARTEYTEKEMLDFAANFRKENHIKNMAFVLNAVKKENTRYGKKYAYGYYHDSPKRSWKSIFGN